MQVLIDAREKLNIPWENLLTSQAANQVMLFRSGYDLDLETFRQNAPIIHRLWQDRAIKKAFDRRREFQLVRLITIDCLSVIC
jgi:guanine nucleotide-binding protein subunit alpha-12